MTRSPITEVDLNALLDELFAQSSRCAQCRVGRVSLTPVDGDGCNWRLDRVEGGHGGDCLMAIAGDLLALRRQYRVCEPAATAASIVGPDLRLTAA